MDKKKVKKLSFTILIVVLILLAAIFLMPRRINRTEAALEWSTTDESILTEHEILVKGWYHPISNTFKGGIVLPGEVEYYWELEQKQEATLYPTDLFFNKNNMAVLTYYAYYYSSQSLDDYGAVFARGAMRDMAIVLEANSKRTSRVFSFGVADRDEAIEQLREYYELIGGPIRGSELP